MNDATSCAFALAVAQKFVATGQMAPTIYVQSPVTGDTYGMVCATGARGQACWSSTGAYVWMD